MRRVGVGAEVKTSKEDSKLEAENKSLKAKVKKLENENKACVAEITDLKEKIAKMEKVEGGAEPDKDGKE